MDIQKYIKKDKSIVIEIDSVEYLLDNAALAAVAREDEMIPVIRLYDHEPILLTRIAIYKALSEGEIDYLDK